MSHWLSPMPPSRPFPFRRHLLLVGVAMVLLLFAGVEPLDFAISELFYEPGDGFVGRHSFWLERILHDGVKQVLIALAVFAIAGFILSFFWSRLFPWRRTLGYLVLAIALSTSIVTPLKRLTGMHCPWSLQEFGGSEPFRALLEPLQANERPGQCWPGGHASAGFSLLAFFFALRDRAPQAARIALLLALGLGSVMSLGRVMQGAHFLSHNMWTLLFDWSICLLCYRMILYRPALQEAPAEVDLPLASVGVDQ